MVSETDPLVVAAPSDSSETAIRHGAERDGWSKMCLSFLVGLGVGAVMVRWSTTRTHHVAVGVFPPSSPLKANQKYSATQFISFSINTLGGLNEFGECDGRPVDKEDGLCYLGNPNDLEDDLNHRFDILQEVLLTLKEDTLLEEQEIDDSPHVLKIFMLPEFYLRGPHGAYSAKELYRGKDALLLTMADRVRDLVSDDAFEDYLFVLGTVIMADSESSTWMNVSTTGTGTSTSAVSSAATQDNDDHNKVEKEENNNTNNNIMYFNVAPVFRGGSIHANERYLVPKNYISNADFLNRNQGLPDPRQSHMVAYNAFGSELTKFFVEERKVQIVTDGILNVDGIKIGIEICLDHRLGVLWKHLQTTHDTTNNPDDDDALVDVHLIISAGMAIERGPTPLRTGGVVYLTDGGANSAACVRTDVGPYDPLVVCRDHGPNNGPTGLRHVPMGGKGYSSYIELAACLNPDNAPWKSMMKGYYSDHATQGCAYTLKIHGIDVFDEEKYDSYPPSIEIYPTVDLPH
jgi:hypothetical protein